MQGIHGEVGTTLSHSARKNRDVLIGLVLARQIGEGINGDIELMRRRRQVFEIE
jgi:hypothetical protein